MLERLDHIGKILHLKEEDTEEEILFIKKVLMVVMVVKEEVKIEKEEVIEVIEVIERREPIRKEE